MSGEIMCCAAARCAACLALGADARGAPVRAAQELAAPSAMCLRDGKWSEIPVRELVPGDVVELKGGDIIPADCTVRRSPPALHNSVSLTAPPGCNPSLSSALRPLPVFCSWWGRESP